VASVLVAAGGVDASGDTEWDVSGVYFDDCKIIMKDILNILCDWLAGAAGLPARLKFAGLPARDADGDKLAPLPSRNLMPFFFFGPSAPSDISPAVPSPSLMTADGLGGADWISDSFEGLRLSFMMDDFLGWVPAAGAEDDRAGDIGLEGAGVDVPVGWDDETTCFFLCFFRLDSLPLVSDADRFGEPGRLRLLTFF
jgi:hypothetical protein